MSGAVFLSDTNSRRVFRVKSTTVVKDLVKNSEVVAGTGDQCLPFDDTRCGDGGKATEATLTNPRGKASHLKPYHLFGVECIYISVKYICYIII